MKKVQQLITGIVLYMATLCSFNQGNAQAIPGLLDNTIKHTITSTFNSKEYSLYVSLPKNYSATDTSRYAVLYVLDGKYSFTTFHSIRELMDLGKELKDIVIVSIENRYENDADWLVGRHYDLTPTSLPESDAQWEKIMQIPPGKLKSGGAPLFLNTIEKDIIPYIEKNYRTSKDRGLSGHSLGGLFATYCFINRPELFNKYGINSPSYWWNNNEMLTMLNAHTGSLSMVKAQLFLSIGELEGDMMTTPYKAFLEALKNQNIKGLQLSDKTFEGESHLSVVPACSSRTLKVLYGRSK